LNPSVLTAWMKAVQSVVVKVRTGPVWSLLSRTAVVRGMLATSTQAPPLLSLRLDLRQVGWDVFMVSLWCRLRSAG